MFSSIQVIKNLNFAMRVSAFPSVSIMVTFLFMCLIKLLRYVAELIYEILIQRTKFIKAEATKLEVCSSKTRKKPTPLAARFKAWVCGRSLIGIVGSNPTGGHGCLFLLSVLCCQVGVSATC